MACMFIASMIARQKRQRREKRQQEIAYRRAIEQARAQEQRDKVFKAETGHIATQLYLAKEAERSQPKEALYWYEKAALQDNEIAMHGMVRVCQRAQSDPIYQKKAQFWQNAINASQGNDDAKFTKAKALIDGSGVEKSEEKGLNEMQTVAEKGHVDALNYMGDWEQSPNNMNRDYQRAANWFRQAATLNSTTAMIHLGELYEQGKGVVQDTGKAGYWYELAGERGDLTGQYKAGCLWARADGNNRSVAYVWLFMAAKSGHAESVKQRDAVASSIGVDVIVGLQALAKPLHQKITNGSVTKHSIIKALNKLYKRPIHLPGQSHPAGDETPKDSVGDPETKSDAGSTKAHASDKPSYSMDTHGSYNSPSNSYPNGQ
jgi:TPR repeat protein